MGQGGEGVFLCVEEDAKISVKSEGKKREQSKRAKTQLGRKKRKKKKIFVITYYVMEERGGKTKRYVRQPDFLGKNVRFSRQLSTSMIYLLGGSY